MISRDELLTFYIISKDGEGLLSLIGLLGCWISTSFQKLESVPHLWPMSNTTGTTIGTGTVFSSGTHEFTPVFSRVHVTRSLVLCVMFCRSLFVLLSFVFWHYVVCSSSIYGYWLPFWYLQSLLGGVLSYWMCLLGYVSYQPYSTPHMCCLTVCCFLKSQFTLYLLIVSTILFFKVSNRIAKTWHSCISINCLANMCCIINY